MATKAKSTVGEVVEAVADVAKVGTKQAPIAWAIAFSVIGLAAIAFFMWDTAGALSRDEFVRWAESHEDHPHGSTQQQLNEIKTDMETISDNVGESIFEQKATTRALGELHTDLREIREEIRDR